MNYNDHAPPHFHARYGGENAAIEIDTLTLIAGSLPPGLWDSSSSGACFIVMSCDKTGSWDYKVLRSIAPLQ